MTFIDFFAGIGGFRKGFEMAGHKPIGFCENDKYAIKAYKAMYKTEGEWFSDDITKLKGEDIPSADIWTFGFPCSDVSIAGKQCGIRGDRSGLYFTLIGLVKGKKEEDKPEWLVGENVANLLSINNGFDFNTVLIEMDGAGYDVFWQVINSKHYVPQNRKRVFIIGHLRSRGGRKILPVSGESTNAIKQIIGGMQGYRVYDTDGISTTLVGNAGGVGAKTGLYLIDQSKKNPKITETARCITSRYNAGIINRSASNSAVLEAYPILTPDRLEKRQNGRRVKEDGEPMFTITSQDRHGVIIKETTDDTQSQVECENSEYRIRRLTPRECFRLQGFSDELFEKAQGAGISDSQLYKMAGNAVTVNVTYEIAKTIAESEVFINKEDEVSNGI